MIKAIETAYKGYRFRSRLEARWAVFFDALGIKWQYEPEGFELEGGVRYLPDFCVRTPQGKLVWYEIKAEHVEQDPKFSAFARATPDRSALLNGDPVQHLSRRWKLPNGASCANTMCPRCGLIADLDYGIVGGGRSAVLYGCHPCDMETPGGGGNSSEPGVLGVPTEPYKGSLLVEPEEYNILLLEIARAAVKARSARFEHGESGAWRR